MDRRAWWATVHGVTKADTTEQLIHTHTHTHTAPVRGGSLEDWGLFEGAVSAGWEFLFSPYNFSQNSSRGSLSNAPTFSKKGRIRFLPTVTQGVPTDDTNPRSLWLWSSISSLLISFFPPLPQPKGVRAAVREWKEVERGRRRKLATPIFSTGGLGQTKSRERKKLWVGQESRFLSLYRTEIIIEKHKSYNQKDFLKTAFDMIFYPKNGEEWIHSTWLKWQKTCH